MNKTHIMFMGGFSFPSGFAATRLIKANLAYLKLQNTELSILSLDSPVSGDPGGRFLHDKIDVLHYRGAAEDGCVFTGGFSRQVKQFIRERHNDESLNILIHYGFPSHRNLAYLLLAKRLGYKVVHWVVEDYNAYDLRTERYLKQALRILTVRFFDRLIPSLSDGIVVLSRWLYEKYEGRGVPVTLIPITVDREEVHSEHISTQDALRIVYAGTFGDKDGVDDLIEGFRILKKSYPDTMLQLIGGGRYAAEYEKKYGSEAGLNFSGYVADAEFESMLNNADILCMTRVNSPYANAGFPYKLGEYLLTGKPVVATDVSDVSEYLKTKEDAMVVPPDNPQAIADALSYLIDHPDQAEKIGSNGRRVAETVFSPAGNGSALLHFTSHL